MPKTLLLADDSVTIQKVVGITFANEDVELLTVDNGADALARAKERRPDLILADVGMPEMDGYELCAAIKRDPQLARIPVLLLTGTFEGFDENRMAEVGADGHISKPFEAQALVDRVWQLLRSGAAAGPTQRRAEPKAAPSASPAPAPSVTPRPAPTPPRAVPPTPPAPAAQTPSRPAAHPAPKAAAPPPAAPKPVSQAARMPSPPQSVPAPKPPAAPKAPTPEADRRTPVPSAGPLSPPPPSGPFPAASAPPPKLTQPLKPAPAPQTDPGSGFQLARGGQDSLDDESLPRPMATPLGRMRAQVRVDPGFSFEDLDFAGPTDATQVISPRGLAPVDPSVEDALYDEAGFLRSHGSDDGSAAPEPLPDIDFHVAEESDDSQSSIFGEEMPGSSQGDSRGDLLGESAPEEVLQTAAIEDEPPLVEGLEPIEGELDDDDEDPATRLALESFTRRLAPASPTPKAPSAREAQAGTPFPDLDEIPDAELELVDPDVDPFPMPVSGSKGPVAQFMDAFIAEPEPPRAERSAPPTTKREDLPRTESKPVPPRAPEQVREPTLERSWTATVARPSVPESALAGHRTDAGSMSVDPLAAAGAVTQPLPGSADGVAFDARALQEALEKVAWEAFGSLSEQVVGAILKQVEQIAWETIPKLAERLIREEIQRLQQED